MRSDRHPLQPFADPSVQLDLWALSQPAPVTRAFALFLAAFSLLGWITARRCPGFDPNLWWVDLRWLPGWSGSLLLIANAFLLAAFAFRPVMAAWRRSATTVSLSLLTAVALTNTVTFFLAWQRGWIQPAIPVPLSLLIAALLLGLARNAGRIGPGARPPASGLRSGLGLAACFTLFPLAQVFFFGLTDYRRPADAAVVFGARAYADGRPSDALADRVRTGCELYRQGLVRKLILSGGPGDGAISEPESMRRLALTLGVPDTALILDPQGLNTRATVANAGGLLARDRSQTLLAVSHFYHLPRIKLAGQAANLQVFTVPARESYLLRQLPYSILREVPAWWTYLFRSVLACGPSGRGGTLEGRGLSGWVHPRPEFVFGGTSLLVRSRPVPSA